MISLIVLAEIIYFIYIFVCEKKNKVIRDINFYDLLSLEKDIAFNSKGEYFN